MKYFIRRSALCTAIILSIAGCGGPKFLMTESQDVAPGVRYQRFTTEQPNRLYVLRVDLRDPRAQVAVFRTKGLVRTSRLVEEASRRGEAVTGAVNGDFFSFKTGWPVGNQVSDGKVVAALASPRSHLAVDWNGRTFVGPVAFDGLVSRPTGGRWTVATVNQSLSADAVGAFTDAWYDSVGSLNGTTGMWMTLLDNQWSASDTMHMVVDSIAPAQGGQKVAERQLLVAASNAGKQFSGVLQGDTMSVYLGFSPRIAGLRELIGGGGRILIDGAATDANDAKAESMGRDFIERRHPRTFVAFYRDTTTLSVCAVDGRQAQSAGMSFHEMALFLRELGAWQAINLDGGGSTTMVVQGRVVNSPSDKTGERPVANILLIRQK